MTWVCGVDEHMDTRSDYARQNPAAKPVTLAFSRYPNELILDNSPGLCDALKAGGHPLVPVVIQPYANSAGRYTGFTVVTIDGHTPAGGYGGGTSRLGDMPNPSLNELLR
jgi:hypothetical protein